MQQNGNEAVEQRKRYVEAWNRTLINIWQERIYKLHVIDTGFLWRSPVNLPVRADGRFYEVSLSQVFAEHGLWQDLGVGRETPHGNTGDIGRDKVRQRRRWYSTKSYSSVMALRDFMAESIGREFVGIMSNLDASKQRANTSYYRRKGWS